MFIIIDENMLRTDYEQQVESIMQTRFSDFDALEDIEVLAQTERMCIVRTRKLTPTMFFMQRA